MYEKITSSLVPVSGMVGGLAEASINNSNMNIVIAASLSALVGYAVKLFLDLCIYVFKHNFLKDEKNK